MALGGMLREREGAAVAAAPSPTRKRAVTGVGPQPWLNVETSGFVLAKRPLGFGYQSQT